MTIEEKLDLVRQVGEEIVTEEDLKKLLESGEELIAYDGFEPSGQIHIAQGLVRAININKMTRTGIRFKMWVADWHAMANNKMGGDLEKIKIVGKYFIEVWKACGMDMSKVEFVWASDMVKNPDYWKLVIQVGRTNVLKRFIRTAEMMGRAESLDSLTGANIIYSCMQVADIFMLDAKITQLGMDQRKLNMLAREVGPQLGYWKPVVVSHHMLMGLTKISDVPPTPEVEERRDLPAGRQGTSGVNKAQGLPGGDRLAPRSLGGVGMGSPGVAETGNKLQRTIALKMSKSNPDSAIFMTDSTEDIQRKINKAYCLEGDIKENPILEYCKYIIFPSLPTTKAEQKASEDARFERLGRPVPSEARDGREPTGDEKRGIELFIINRPEKFGGPVTVSSYEDLEAKFANKEIHPMDLKTAVATKLDELLSPVRRHFEENEEAKNLLEQVKSFQVTR